MMAPSPFRPPALTELIGTEIGNRIAAGQERILDRLGPVLPDLPARRPVLRAAARPAVPRRPRGGWHAEHNKTLNGLWLRMSQITVDSMAQFQIGEQRFQLRVK